MNILRAQLRTSRSLWKLSSSRFSSLPVKPDPEMQQSQLKFDQDQYSNIHIRQADVNTFLKETNDKDQKQRTEDELRQMFVNHIDPMTQQFKDQAGATAIWLYLDLTYADKLQTLIEDKQFKLHHTKYVGGQPQFVLTKWLVDGVQSKLPHYSSHTLGVGGVVLHPNNREILLIKERFTPSHWQNWKFPGGMVDMNESLEDAAIREVWEETGVETKFEGVLGMRELTKFRHDQGDVYFPCLLRAIGDDPNIIIDRNELAEAEWMPFKDLRNVEFFSIAHQIMNEVILPNVSDEGEWVGKINSPEDKSLQDHLKYMTFYSQEKEVYGRIQKFYSLWQGKRKSQEQDFDFF